MGTLIAWAGDHGIERMELYVRSDNDRAIRMYDSLGFERESVRRRYIRDPDGSHVDDFVLVRFLGES